MKFVASLLLFASVFSCGPQSSSYQYGSHLSDSSFRLAMFPRAPDPRLTTGSTCRNGNELRYPERVPYCSRNVSSDTKKAIFAAYDRELGYRTQDLPRDSFKIDHYIPLCMGGSNNRDNLWPQHESIWHATDPVDEALCVLMQRGRLLQVDAIRIIKEVKAAPETAQHRLMQLSRGQN